MSLYQAEGIVLANRDLGEADRVVTLFCREQGKIDAVARGARRPRNRMVGTIEEAVEKAQRLAAEAA